MASSSIGSEKSAPKNLPYGESDSLGVFLASANAKSPVPQHKSSTRASVRDKVAEKCLAVFARHSLSNDAERKWLRKSYRGAMLLNISRTRAAASCSLREPSGCVPRATDRPQAYRFAELECRVPLMRRNSTALSSVLIKRRQCSPGFVDDRIRDSHAKLCGSHFARKNPPHFATSRFFIAGNGSQQRSG